MARVLPWVARPSRLKTLLSHVRLSARLVREPSVPIYAKALPVAAGLYTFLPVDFVPDFLPVLGQLDDLGLLVVALGIFVALCPAAAVAFHRRAIAEGRSYSPMPAGGEFIDATFRRENS
jgi:uncharacterized membrane protein YkvA (DUF1232 family)